MGFNARPIACSLHRAGASVYVSDYWGDEDLSACCTQWTAVLSPKPYRRQRQPIGGPLHEVLVENLLELTSETEPLDCVFFGSGFDDHPDALQSLYDRTLLVGNETDVIRRSRDRHLLERLLGQDGSIRLPKTRTADLYMDDESKWKFPLIIRPKVSGGGAGIRLVRNHRALLSYVRNLANPSEHLVQEYIRGLDVSCSVLSTANKSQTLSIQGQLVGMPSAGLNCSFAYCGNYIPVQLPSSCLSRIDKVSTMLSSELGLRGSNGFDFVVTPEGEPVLMEVNPRLQGSLELLEIAGGISVVSLHYDAFHGILSNQKHRFRAAVKMIVYSRTSQEVKNLSGVPGAVDRSPEKVRVNRGDPICTLLQSGDSLTACYRNVSATARKLMLQDDAQVKDKVLTTLDIDSS